MVIDSRQKRFAMNMQLRQCFARVKLFRLKNPDFVCFFFLFSKKAERVKKIKNFKIWLQKSQIGTLLHVEHSRQ